MVEPIRTPAVSPPEPFPGFVGLTKTVARDVRAAEKRLQETEGALAAHESMRWSYAFAKPARPAEEYSAWFRETYKKQYGEEFQPPQGWEARKSALLVERQEAVRQLGRVSWFSDFYDIVPNLINIGAVDSLESYLEQMKSNPEGILNEEDYTTARDTITRLVGERTVEAREDAPEWLQITPEQETAVREAFALEPKPPETIHRITVNDLVKSLTRHPDLVLPEEMTTEQVLQLASIMDIPPEDVTRVVDYTELLEPYSAAIAEREEHIKAVLAGDEKWQMPETGFWQKALLAVASPMQVFADVFKPYIENVSYPLAGFVASSVARLRSSTTDIEDKYAQMRALGYNWWDSMSEAYQDWTLPWYWKLPLEIITDPITYIPGIALKVPAFALTKIPLTITRRMGAGLYALNKGLWNALDMPFDAFKAFWGSLPKTFNQATKFELNSFRDLLVTAASKQSSKVVGSLSVDDLTRTLERAMKDFAADPLRQNDVFVELGAELVKHAPLDENAVRIWSRSLGGQLDTITEKTLTDVDDIIRDSLLKIGSPAEHAKRLAVALAIEDNPSKIGKLIKDLGTITNRYSSRVPRAIEIGKNAKIAPVRQMTEYLVTGQKAIIQATERSTFAKGKVFEGMVLSLMNKVDKLERGAWRMTLDRWLVRPAAEAYLGSVAYPIWNALESMVVSSLEGIVPRQAKQEAFQRMFLGVRGVDNRVLQWSASDVAGMLGTMPGREGAISILPGKIPEKVLGLKVPKWVAGKDWFEWAGKKWIELSDVWGTGYRANFLMRKMSDYLAEYSFGVAGQDLNAAFKRLVGKAPSVNKGTLGLTSHELEQEMFARLTTGIKSEVLGMKELLSNSSLMQGEALKILRQAEQISPQAKALGEQLIAQGKYRTEEEILNFCKTVADQSIADLRSFPQQAPDTFRFMADQMESLAQTEIKSADDLMQVFQHYEVMSDTASKVPTKLLGQVFEQSDELKRLGKFSQLETLWRTSRKQVEDAVDSVNDSLNRARAVIQSKSSLLTDKQQNALNALLERQTARVQLQEQFLRADGRLLDDFWALPKAMRTADEYTALRAYRLENMLKFKGEDAVLGAGDFLERKSYSELYHSLPKPKLFRVDASARALTADDCAKTMSCNVDALTTGMMESMTFQDKPYFIQMIKQSADAHPTYYKGFTENKIGQVYDDIIRGMRMTPEQDIMSQKILQQIEGVKQRMIALRMTHSLSPTEEKLLHSWIDDVAAGMDDVFGAGKKKGIVSKAEWDDIRQKASDSAHREYYKAFADYTNENIIDAVGKSIYPFWTYHLYRWFFLPRTFIKHPGVAAAWGKYYEYSDYGYVHIPGTDLEFNPAVGSAFGATFSLGRHDFKNYYENLGWAGEFLDYTQRRGFFPGIHVTLPIALTSVFSDRPPELGEVLPPIYTVGLNLFVASKIPGVSDAATWLKDRVFHSNFHDYYTSTIVSSKQVESGGKLVGGQTGVDLWFKKQRGEKLTTEEQALWGEAYGEAAWYGVLRSEFPEFRMRAEEMLEAYQQVTNLIEAQTGMTEKMQDDLWRHNLRPTDVLGGLPLDLRMSLDQMWQWRIYFGRGSILMPPEYSDLYNLIDKYYDKVESAQIDRLATQSETNTAFLTPTKEQHLSGGEWRRDYASNWSSYTTRVESLEKDPEFADAVDALTPEGQVRLAKELGFTVPPTDPMSEVIRLYFEIELEEVADKYTGEIDYDYLGFWLKREAVRMALPEEQRSEFDAYVRRYQTPMEVLFKQVTNEYLRGYRAVSRIVLEEFTEDEKALIAEFYADATTRERKLQIQDTESHSGKKLISYWDSRRTDVRNALRRASPKLDFWLYVFGYISKPLTPEAEEMVRVWEADKPSIVRGITETPMLEKILERIDEQKLKELAESTKEK